MVIEVCRNKLNVEVHTSNKFLSNDFQVYVIFIYIIKCDSGELGKTWLDFHPVATRTMHRYIVKTS